MEYLASELKTSPEPEIEDFEGPELKPSPEIEDFEAPELKPSPEMEYLAPDLKPSPAITALKQLIAHQISGLENNFAEIDYFEVQNFAHSRLYMEMEINLMEINSTFHALHQYQFEEFSNLVHDSEYFSEYFREPKLHYIGAYWNLKKMVNLNFLGIFEKAHKAFQKDLAKLKDKV